MCHNGIVYVRHVNGQELNFGVSGMLLEGSLVMHDEETGSLWSHLLGSAMQGPLKGQELEIIPAIITDWETWHSRYPSTTVALMERSAVKYTRGMLAEDSAYGIGLVLEDQAKSWPVPLSGAGEREKQEVINDELSGRKLLVYFDARTETAAVYERTIDGADLTFHIQDDTLLDQETGSTWDPITGTATDGPRKGERLVSLPAIISELAVWSVYHPDAPIFSASQAAAAAAEAADNSTIPSAASEANESAVVADARGTAESKPAESDAAAAETAADDSSPPVSSEPAP